MIKLIKIFIKAIKTHFKYLHEESTSITSSELLDMLGEEFKEEINTLDIEDAIKGYNKLKKLEWQEQYTTQTD